MLRVNRLNISCYLYIIVVINLAVRLFEIISNRMCQVADLSIFTP